MEQNKVLCCALVAVAVLALLFQAVGLFSPAWLRISARVDLGSGGSGAALFGANNDQNDQTGSSDLDGMGNIGQSFPSDGNVGQTNDWPNAKSMSSASGFGSSVGGSSGLSNFEDLGNKMYDEHPHEEVHKAASEIESESPSGLGGTLKTDTNFGLFTASACVKTALFEKCMDYDDIKKQVGSDEQSLGNISINSVFGELHKCAVLATLGFVAAIAGCIVMFILLRTENATKAKGIVCAALWGLSVIFTLAAVSMQAQQNSTYNNSFKILKAMPLTSGLDLDMPFPWALLMSGLGCLFAAVAGVMVSVAVCYMPSQTEAWTRFNNQAV